MKYLLLFLMILSVNVYGQDEIREYLFTPSDENVFVPQQVVKNGNYYELTFGERGIDDFLGLYSVALIADGEIVDSKTLIKE